LISSLAASARKNFAKTPVVAHRHAHHTVLHVGADDDPAAAGRVLDRVREQVRDHAGDALAIALHHERLRR
jgi:hypothetical protein